MYNTRNNNVALVKTINNSRLVLWAHIRNTIENRLFQRLDFATLLKAQNTNIITQL